MFQFFIYKISLDLGLGLLKKLFIIGYLSYLN